VTPSSERHAAVHDLLEAAGFIPYQVIADGHRIGESVSGFVILESGDGKTLVRLRPGDDWLSGVASVQAEAGLEDIGTAEYAHSVSILSDWSRALKAHGYTVGQRNSRTLVILDPAKAAER